MLSDRLLADLLDEPYYEKPAPKSTGKELFHWPYVRDRLAPYGQLPANDVIATLTELSARVVAAELRRHELTEVFASGGGTHNRWLMQRLAELAPESCEVRSIAELGVRPDDKEAYAFALLGFLTLHGLHGTVPSCTGAVGPSLVGSITPGRSPLRLPQPARRQPTRLVIGSP